MVLELYYVYVIGYFAVAALISFAVCYYKGPVADPRSLNLIKWSIQLLALVMLYNSSQLTEISIALIVLVLIKWNFPTFLTKRLKAFW